MRPNREQTTAITSFDSRWDPQEMLKMRHEEIVVESDPSPLCFIFIFIETKFDLFILFFSFVHTLFSEVQFLRTVNYKMIVYLSSKGRGKHSLNRDVIPFVRCNLCRSPYCGLVVMFLTYLDGKWPNQYSSCVCCKVEIQDRVRLGNPSYSLSTF